MMATTMTRIRQRVKAAPQPSVYETLCAEHDYLVTRLEQGWELVAAAKDGGDPRADRWEVAWIYLLYDYERKCDELEAFEELMAA